MDITAMRKVGLSSREMELICGVFQRHREITAAVLYGSRAKRKHQPESDVDLAIQGDLDELGAASVAAEMDELPLPYRFDVQAYTAIQSATLRDEICNTGVVVYGTWK